jgi:hypothetical protein
MAQPNNTFDSYDQVGIREDLQDVIYDISPEETPFYTACAKMSAKNTFHEWQTDALRDAADNFHIEGGDTTAENRSATVRLGNYTQIFKNAVAITGTDGGLDKAGRAGEMAYQVMKVAKEQKLDIEKALFANQARSAGSSVAGRRMAGVPAWLTTNTDFQSGSSGADPTGDGTNARTDDGTPTAFSQTKFDGVMQDIWEAGGKPQTVYLTAFQMNLALGFTGNNNQRAQIDATKAQVVKDVVIYRTPWGTVDFQMTRWQRARDVFIMQNDMWAVGMLRPTKNEPLAKTGDNEKRQVITELTLICKNEKASGGIFDNTVS